MLVCANIIQGGATCDYYLLQLIFFIQVLKKSDHCYYSRSPMQHVRTDQKQSIILTLWLQPPAKLMPHWIFRVQPRQSQALRGSLRLRDEHHAEGIVTTLRLSVPFVTSQSAGIEKKKSHSCWWSFLVPAEFIHRLRIITGAKKDRVNPAKQGEINYLAQRRTTTSKGTRNLIILSRQGRTSRSTYSSSLKII